ncbi:MAG: ABC transporter ATP-binding protein [Aquificaceae bacterium]|nr:ABC transporter ATP-binding protein [Aquificaceae bacterium]MCS7196483.1 ABC transporter ATP-binding protein [Aquificaceae bacterium]MDW8032644.1 ABC transporter ATP-binding protein [Aquificaceae bacterium]MDW8294474.1 ABC transporter ATP-binding protein [Aquificaceae bacterium]
MKVIELRGIRKSIGQEEILKGIDLSVQVGEFLAIVGASGSGKSSLLYIMGLLDKPTEGEVFFEGERVDFSEEKRLSELRNKKIGFVFQFHYLLPEFTLLENVMLPAIKLGMKKDEAEERAYELLNSLGLGGKERRRIYQISGGEMQRVAIARALINSPSAILADEPTGNLDSKNSQRVMEIFKEINRRGTTIVMVTHELELAEQAQRLVEIKDGAVLSDRAIQRA